MTTPAQQVELLYAGGDITRYHTQRLIRHQTVAHHSARMAMLLSVVDPDCSAALLTACLYHDISELSTGDLLGPAKWQHPLLAAAANAVTAQFEQDNNLRISLTLEEQDMVKWADRMEGAIYSYEEVMLGNRYMMRSFGAYMGAVRKVPPFEQLTIQGNRLGIENTYMARLRQEEARNEQG